MKVKTSELNGAALDWVVAGLEGEDVWRESRNIYVRDDDGNSVSHYSPSTYWAQCGPIIEREKMRVAYNSDEHIWEAGWDCHVKGWANTPLIAAMRCYVASELGDEVEVPDELNKEQDNGQS
jgi:hypothetical protein